MRWIRYKGPDMFTEKSTVLFIKYSKCNNGQNLIVMNRMVIETDACCWDLTGAINDKGMDRV